MLEKLLGEVIPHAFKIKVRPITPLVKLLKREECVKEITTDEDHVIIIAKDVKAFKQRLPVLVSQANASIEELKVAGRDLESLFKMAVSGD